MSPVTSVASSRPILFSVVVVLVPVLAIRLMDASLGSAGVSVLVSRLMVEAALCAYVLALLTTLGWWRDAGFAGPVALGKLAAYLPLVFLPLVVVAGNGVKAAGAERVLGFAVFTAMVGFAEEGLLRGVVLRALMPIGPMRAALLSSLLFGLGHLVSLAQGASPATTMVQVTYATLLGLGFAGARLYTGTIWPAIAIHALQDFADAAGRGFVLAPPQAITLARAIAPIVITGAYAAYGAWLIRRQAHAAKPA